MELERRLCSLVGVLCCLFVLVKATGLEFTRSDFPSSFVFGSATSAYQVEGAAYEDGRTPSIWDMFTHQGMMPDKSTGDVAADGYHKYKDDVKLMADMGLEAYRFSISWSRLIPDGTGDPNPAGLEYYNNLIDELVKHGIQVHVMLYQLDLPEILQDEYGGWMSPEIIDDFTAYADVCFREFGNRVKYWTTLAEPNIISLAGYDQGSWPPSQCSKPFGVVNCTSGNSTVEPYVVMHNLLLSHASVYNLYRNNYYVTQKGMVGINVYSFGLLPFSDSAADLKAAQRFRDFFIGWILDPLAFGHYPSVMREVVGSRLPTFTKQQSQILKGSFDFIGLNHYMTLYVMDYSNKTNSGPRDYSADTLVRITDNKNATPGSQFTPDIRNVEPDPDGLQHMLEYLKKVYGNPPIYIQENGRGLASNSSLEDTERTEYVRSYIGGTLTAIRNGVDVRGYFVWSFIDLFEYMTGYETTFGLFSVDFNSDDLTRRPKHSAHWYSHFIKNNSTNTTFVLPGGKHLSEQ
ncbi:beta-glucosidase 22-like protein [Carex littledalei]|uniref:Beta-glucosidase 22-like protein n=1 Tax=Carex littledalei TaxID=544730 RepID=A0A833QPI9_9POAL|nr:beta-glucosidase 22-like protein [Carex littledalei]